MRTLSIELFWLKCRPMLLYPRAHHRLSARPFRNSKNQPPMFGPVSPTGWPCASSPPVGPRSRPLTKSTRSTNGTLSSRPWKSSSLGRFVPAVASIDSVVALRFRECCVFYTADNESAVRSALAAVSQCSLPGKIDSAHSVPSYSRTSRAFVLGRPAALPKSMRTKTVYWLPSSLPWTPSSAPPAAARRMMPLAPFGWRRSKPMCPSSARTYWRIWSTKSSILCLPSCVR